MDSIKATLRTSLQPMAFSGYGSTIGTGLRGKERSTLIALSLQPDTGQEFWKNVAKAWLVRANGTDRPWTYSHLLTDVVLMAKKLLKSSRFGDAVRRARMAAGLTQEELADRAGLDRSYIGGVERGDRNPTLSVIEKFAQGLGLTLAELFSYSADEPRA